MNANGQAVVQRGFAGEVNFRVFAEFEVVQVVIIVLVDIDAIAGEMAAEAELQFGLSGGSDERCIDVRATATRSCRVVTNAPGNPVGWAQ